jgi:GTP-binding protein
VVAHVDHGKTSLVDSLLRFTDTASGTDASLVKGSMDSNEIEKERGITILAKCTALEHEGVLHNIVDTPGHADFGGEVERMCVVRASDTLSPSPSRLSIPHAAAVTGGADSSLFSRLALFRTRPILYSTHAPCSLGMVDGVLLVVDALDGPMPQTRYVLSKALGKGLKPVVVINKCDREGARLGAVENEVLDLFVALDATEDQLDFPIVYASAREGWSTDDVDAALAKPVPQRGDMSHLLRTLATHIPPPRVLGGPVDPFRMLVCQMEGDQYMGKLVLGR